MAILCVVGGHLPVSAQQQYILRQQPVEAAPTVPSKPKHSPAPLPFSSLIEVQKPVVRKHVPVEKFVLSSDVLFEPSKDLLTEAGELKLKTLSAALRKSHDAPITIVGHTDDMGFESHNAELTLRQAQRVKSWIVAHGLAKSVAITASGAGSQAPLASAKTAAVRDAAAMRARNRRIEIVIDPNKTIDQTAVAQPVEVKSAPVNAATAVAPAAAPVDSDFMALPGEGAGEGEGIVSSEGSQDSGGITDADSTMVPVSEADLQPHMNTDDGSGKQTAHHKVNEGEWGRGGSDFGNNVSSFGQTSGYGGDSSQMNGDGKRVVKVTPTTEDLDSRRKETIEAQNEFGLWRDYR